MEIKISETIKLLRNKRGISQEGLANALLVTTQAVSKWETGASLPDVQMLPRIAAFFNVSMDDLFFGEKEKEVRQIEEIDDDGVLRIVQYLGKRCLRIEEWERDKPITLDLTDVNAETNMQIFGDAIVNGNVNGFVESKKNIACGNVSDYAQADGGINCGNVEGYVEAGGMVNCGSIEGYVEAGGAVNCGSVGSYVEAGGSVNCGDVGEQVEAGGSVSCGNVGEQVEAGGNVTCTEIGGELSAGGDIHCENIHTQEGITCRDIYCKQKIMCESISMSGGIHHEGF